jgi:DNA-binding NarL/FixJ family response regulator
MSGTEGSTIRVLLADDHEVILNGVKALLRKATDIAVVGEAENTRTAVSEAKRLQPDVILLDVRFPGASGLDACREIRANNPNARVLFLTAYEDEQAILQSISAGGSGFLMKDMNGPRLILAIRNVAAGLCVMDLHANSLILEHVRTSKPAVGTRDSALNVLSAQEARVMALVAEGKTNKEIAGAMGLSH